MSAIPRHLIAGMVLAVLAAGLAHGGRDAQAAGATVTVANFSFTDGASGTSVTTIQAGDTVTWTWADTGAVPHTSTSTSVPGGASTWDSGAHASPFTYGPVTYSVPGTYAYVCSVHPTSMTGTIVVQAASTATPAPSDTAPAATSTAAAAPTDTPVPTATAGAGSPTSSPVPATAASGQPSLIAPPPATPGAEVASATGGALPQAGTGDQATGGHASRPLLLALGLAGAAIVWGGVVMRRWRGR